MICGTPLFAILLFNVAQTPNMTGATEIVGGFTASTLLTLMLSPVIYEWIEFRKEDRV